MSEPVAPSPAIQFPAYGSIRFFHPRSPNYAVLPLPGDPKAAFEAVDTYIAAGWLTNAPGLEAGEDRESIGWVMRGAKSDGTPTITLYSAHEHLKHSLIKIYLDEKDQIVDFERASGMKFENIAKASLGKLRPARGDSPDTDKFIIRCPKPFNVVLKENPKYAAAKAEGKSEEELKYIGQRIVARWGDGPSPDAGQPQAKTDTAPTGVANGQPEKEKPTDFEVHSKYLALIRESRSAKELTDLGILLSSEKALTPMGRDLQVYYCKKFCEFFAQAKSAEELKAVGSYLAADKNLTAGGRDELRKEYTLRDAAIKLGK